ncbi:MAG: hypothetical protein EPN48_18180, partial [Microbacteriaceae bacterium]
MNAGSHTRCDGCVQARSSSTRAATSMILPPNSGARPIRAVMPHPWRAITAMRFVDNAGLATEAYPLNPNGSPGGLTAVTTADGRFTAMMPHPERVFRNIQMSWTPGD